MNKQQQNKNNLEVLNFFDFENKEEMTRLFRKDQLQKGGNNPFGQESFKLSKIFKDINQKDASQVNTWLILKVVFCC